MARPLSIYTLQIFYKHSHKNDVFIHIWRLSQLTQHDLKKKNCQTLSDTKPQLQWNICLHCSEFCKIESDHLCLLRSEKLSVQMQYTVFSILISLYIHCNYSKCVVKCTYSLDYAMINTMQCITVKTDNHNSINYKETPYYC